MKKILVVDDDQFFSKTLETSLKSGEYEIVLAEDGEKGLEQLKKDVPDLIIVDIMMPKMDGISFLKKVKESGDYPNVPILVSSNLSSVKKISDVMALGAVGYVVKSDESLPAIIQDIERIIGEKK